LGKQGKLSEGEIRFAKARFFRHYSRARIEMPPRGALREWGFFLFGGERMHRPVTFMGREELGDYLFRKVPRHTYYSTAYYRNPGLPMESPEKGWMGADLIFDLDADGLPGADELSYEEQLAAVKEEIIRLYDVFLQEHLGFSDDDMSLVFSGGRGYHIHIRKAEVLNMNSDERRQIMDYVAGAFQDFTDIFPRRRLIGSRSVKEEMMLPRDGGGWRGIVSETYPALIQEMQILGMDASVEMMKKIGIRRDVAEHIYEHLFDNGEYDRMLRKGDLRMFGTEAESKAFLRLLEHKVRARYGVHPDIHVTPDIRRLIRLPGSLHGGTGFLVKEISRDELDDFLPTRDAIPEIYEDKKVRVLTEDKIKIAISGEEYVIKGETEVPEPVALFLILSGRASFPERFKT